MPGASNYLELKLLDHYFGSTNYAIPGTYYLALATASIADTDTGSTIGEAGYGGYTKIALVNSTATWANAAAGVKNLAVTVSFPACTSGDGTYTHWALTDNSGTRAGFIICYGTLNVNKIISSGDTPQIAATDLAFTLD